ncbi:MAG: hypothetical protein NT055_04145 [Nitrospirae bacterium]|nr:hypothetical protein [Nitrospirota bacterium]
MDTEDMDTYMVVPMKMLISRKWKICAGRNITGNCVSNRSEAETMPTAISTVIKWCYFTVRNK